MPDDLQIQTFGEKTLANKVKLKFTSYSSIMNIIKKSDKILWLTLIPFCTALLCKLNTENLVPAKDSNINMF